MAYVFQIKNRNGKRSGKWRFQYTDWTGRRRTGTGSLSKRDTEKLAVRIEVEHDEIRRGFRPPPHKSFKHKLRPFAELAQEFIEWGEAQGGRCGRPWGKDHARKYRTRLPWWAEQLKVKSLGDLEHCLPKVERILRTMFNEGKSGKTISHYVSYLQTFLGYCVQRDYLQSDPLKGLNKFNTTPKSHRRAMTPLEIKAITDIAPIHRKLLYMTAICSGLRANELRSLSVKDIDPVRGGLLLHAEWTKNRKEGFQPLPRLLIEQLQSFAASEIVKRLYDALHSRKDSTATYPNEPLLYVPSHPARELDNDLKAANVEKNTKDGKVDFHAFRVAYVTFVLNAGAGLKEAQSLARHSTPDMTMNVYGRAFDDRLAELSEAVGAQILPKKCLSRTETEVNRNIKSAQTSGSKIINNSPAESYRVEAGGVEPPSYLRKVKASTCLVPDFNFLIRVVCRGTVPTSEQVIRKFLIAQP